MNKNPLPLNQPDPARETVSVLVIGSRQSITNTIQTFYRLGYAQISEWSPMLPAPQPGKLMSILTRQIPIN